MKGTSKGGFNIPNNTNETLIIEIVDEYVTFRFNDYKITKKLLQSQIKEGIKSIYFERQQKVISHYPGLSREQLNEKFELIFSKRFEEQKMEAKKIE